MKKLVVLFACMLSLGVFAQQTSGEIIYEVKRNMHINLPEGNEELKKMIPEFQVSKLQMLFTADASLCQNQVADEVDETVEGNGSAMRIRMSGGQNVYFKDLQKEEKIEQVDFMGKRFLVKGDTHERQWKLTGNQKEILGYVCQEAVIEDSTNHISAWFTPQITVASGPTDYEGLPGMILSIDRNHGANTITALEVNLKEIEADQISAPSKGKSVSSEEYRSIVEEKMKEMGATSSGGTFRMIIRN